MSLRLQRKKQRKVWTQHFHFTVFNADIILISPSLYWREPTIQHRRYVLHRIVCLQPQSIMGDVGGGWVRPTWRDWTDHHGFLAPRHKAEAQDWVSSHFHQAGGGGHQLQSIETHLLQRAALGHLAAEGAGGQGTGGRQYRFRYRSEPVKEVHVVHFLQNKSGSKQFKLLFGLGAEALVCSHHCFTTSWLVLPTRCGRALN